MKRANPYPVMAVLSVAGLVACGTTPDAKKDASTPQPSAESPQPAAEAPRPELPSLSRDEVLRARRQFTVSVLSFDASRSYGSGYDAADRVRLKIRNGSKVTLPCLTIRTSRFVKGEEVGWSRAPSIPTTDLSPGEEKELEYYPKGHLSVGPTVEKITVGIERTIDADSEKFFCEPKGAQQESSARPVESPRSSPKPQAANGPVIGDTWDEALPKLNAIGPREDLIRLDPDAYVDVRGGRRFTFRRPSEPDLGPYRIVSFR